MGLATPVVGGPEPLDALGRRGAGLQPRLHAQVLVVLAVLGQLQDGLAATVGAGAQGADAVGASTRLVAGTAATLLLRTGTRD